MEVINGDLNGYSNVILNGYMNKSFEGSLTENNTDSMAICELDPCEVSGVSTQLQGGDTPNRYEKKAKGPRIWSLVSRRRANSGRSKRPQSLILTSEVNEPKPKLSFMDKVRSFKRLRSATFSKSSVLRNSKAKVQSQPSEDIELTIPSTLFRTRKYADGQRPYRHSYAGYIDDLDTSFEDVELNISISECISSDTKWLRNMGDGINGQQEFMTNDNLGCHRRRALVGTKSSTIAEGEIQRRGLKMTPEHQRGRSSYMWSYLKGISLTTKDNAKGFDKFQGNAFQNAVNTAENVSSAGTDQRLEESVCLSTTTDSASGGKPKNLAGVFKFFSNVAEAARKWRGSSRSSASDVQVSQSTPKTPRLQNSFINKPLVIENENASSFSSEPPSTSESGTCENHHKLDNLFDQDISFHITPEEEPINSECVIPQTSDDNTLCLNDTLCGEVIPQDSSQDLFELSQPEESTSPNVPSLGSETSSENSQPQAINESPIDENLDRNPETSFMTQSSLLDAQDEDVFECTESHCSLSTASSCEEGQWQDGFLDISREEDENQQCENCQFTHNLLNGSIQEACEDDDTVSIKDGTSIKSDSVTDQKSHGSGNVVLPSPGVLMRDRSIIPPVRLPPTPLTVPPSFKFPLDRCMSLPLSQSTPSGLDQVGWMKRKLMSTGEDDLGSKTLEVRRDGRKGSRWKALHPGSEQLPVHQTRTLMEEIQDMEEDDDVSVQGTSDELPLGPNLELLHNVSLANPQQQSESPSIVLAHGETDTTVPSVHSAAEDLQSRPVAVEGTTPRGRARPRARVIVRRTPLRRPTISQGRQSALLQLWTQQRDSYDAQLVTEREQRHADMVNIHTSLQGILAELRTLNSNVANASNGIQSAMAEMTNMQRNIVEQFQIHNAAMAQARSHSHGPPPGPPPGYYGQPPY